MLILPIGKGQRISEGNSTLIKRIQYYPEFDRYLVETKTKCIIMFANIFSQ